MSEEITPEEAKAFADDLAYIQKKHKIEIVVFSGENEIMRYAPNEHDSRVFLSKTEVPNVWEFVEFHSADVTSEDFDNMSAHDLMLWKKKQGEKK